MEITSVPLFLEYLDRVHERTRRIARCVREEDFEWQAGIGRMTAGDLVSTIAYYDQLHAESRSLFATLTDVRLAEKSPACVAFRRRRFMG